MRSWTELLPALSSGVVRVVPTSSIVMTNAVAVVAKEFGVKWPKAVEDHRRQRGTSQLLRLSGGTLEALEDHQPDRDHICSGKGSHGPHQGTWLTAGLALISKLIKAAQWRWRKLTGAHLVALVMAGTEFRNGELVERSEEKVAA